MARLERVARDHAEGERDAYAKTVTLRDRGARRRRQGEHAGPLRRPHRGAVGQRGRSNSSSETIGLLETSGQLAWAALTSITAAETTSHLIGGTPVRVGAGIPPELFRDDRVIESLWAATVALDAATAIRIGRFDLDLVGPRARPDEIATFRALAAWWTGSPDVGRKLIAALEATDPEQADEGADEEDRLLDIAVPVLAAMRFALAGDAAGSTREIQLGGEAFDKYWSRPRRKSEPAGFLALALSGVMALARATGLDVDVDHPVIPARAGADAPAVLLCPRCAEPIHDGETACVWCRADLTVDAAIEQPFAVWFSAPREPCPRCAALHHPLALDCWSCHQPLATD